MRGARSNRPTKRKMLAGARAPSAISDNGSPANIELIFKPELLELLHVSYSSIFGWMRAGKFPVAHIISPSSGRSSRIAWYASDVQAWLASRPQRVIKPRPS